MSRIDQLALLAQSAVSVLGGTVEPFGEGISVRLEERELALNLSPTDDPVTMAPLHQLASHVRHVAGRVHLVSMHAKVMLRELGTVAPSLVVRFQATYQSAAPVTQRFGLLVSLESHEIKTLAAPVLGTLAPELRPGRERQPQDLVEKAWSAALSAAQVHVQAGAEECRSTLLSLQSRRRREIEEVFRTRLMNLDELSGEGDDGDSAARLERERQAALDHALAWYDPNRLRVELRTPLILLIHAGSSRRKERPHG